MADNFSFTEGSGATGAADDIGGVYYPLVKLVDGTADAAGVIAADIGAKANAMRVAPANDITDGTYIGDIKFGEGLAAGSNAIGSVVLTSGAADIGTVALTSGSAIIGALASGASIIGKLNANSGVDIGDVDVLSCANTAGDKAHDAADAGNPIKVGGKAYNFDGSAPGTATAEGDRVHFVADVYGRQFVELAHPNSNWANESATSAQTANELVAGVTGVSICVTDIILSNGATAGNIKLVETTSSPSNLLGPYNFAVNGGMTYQLKTPKKLTAEEGIGYTSVACTTHTVSVGYFLSP